MRLRAPSESEGSSRIDLLAAIADRMLRPAIADCESAIQQTLEDLGRALGAGVVALAGVDADGAGDPKRLWVWSPDPRSDTLDLVGTLWNAHAETLLAGDSALIEGEGDGGVEGSAGPIGRDLTSLVIVPCFHDEQPTLLICGGSHLPWDEDTQVFLRTVVNLLVATCHQREARVDLALSQQDLGRALDLAGLGSFVFDFKSGEVHLSSAMARIYGFGDEPTTVTAADTVECYHPDDRRFMLHLLGDVARAGPTGHVDLRVMQKEGEPRLVRFRSELIRDTRGDPIALRGTALDVSAVEGRGSEVARAEEAAYRAKVEAQLERSRRLESLGLLAGGIAHDFNNMLAIISNHAALLTNAVVTDPQGKADLEAIRTTVKEAAALTKRLLAVGGRQPGACPKTELDLTLAVEQNLRLLESSVPKGVTVSFEASEDVPDVCADPSDVRQILSNLVLNALDAVGDEGAIAVGVGSRVVALDEAGLGMAAGPYAVVEVIDDGVGMTSEQRQRAFDPFFTTKGGDGGSGLGLSIVHGIATSLFGWVRLESEENSGTRVRVGIPAATPGDDSDRDASVAQTGGQGVVLLVDDQEELLRSTARLLRRNGLDVLEACSPAEAIEIAREHEGRVDMVVSDVVMPEMSGFDLVERLRSLNPEIVALHMSGHVPNARGTGTILMKPFEPDDLIEAVHDALLARVRR